MYKCKWFQCGIEAFNLKGFEWKRFAIELRVTDAFIPQTNSCVTSVALGHM